MFIELHAQSAFSFLEGAELPEAFAGAAARLEMPAVALVDRDGVFGAPRFTRAAGGEAARRRLHVHPREDRPRSRRPAPLREWRVQAPERPGDDTALPRSPRRARQYG